MKEKLTEWFSEDQKPVRHGVYPTRFRCGSRWEEGYSRWNGAWSQQYKSPVYANGGICILARQDKQWRGLTKEPKK